MNHYELLVILPGKLSETEVPGAENTLRDLCRSSGLSITREESLGKRKLSYDIRGEQYGYYHVIEGDAEQATVTELGKRLTLSPDILRHAVYEKPVKSKVVQEREMKLRERVAHARATKAATATHTRTGTIAAPLSAPMRVSGTLPGHLETDGGIPTTATVDVAALDKKLEELLTTPEGV